MRRAKPKKTYSYFPSDTHKQRARVVCVRVLLRLAVGATFDLAAFKDNALIALNIDEYLVVTAVGVVRLVGWRAK